MRQAFNFKLFESLCKKHKNNLKARIAYDKIKKIKSTSKKTQQ